MIKIIAPNPNVSVPMIERALLVLYPLIQKTPGSGRWRDFRNYLVYYRANPRNVDYMLDLANDFRIRHATNASFDLLIDPTLGKAIPEKHSSWIGRIWTALSLQNLTQSRYDTIIYLYPDAIGLGWEELESALLHFKAVHYLVINGRRRIFVWDNDSRWALALRRFIARARGLEMLLSFVLLGAASILALYDRLTGQAEK